MNKPWSAIAAAIRVGRRRQPRPCGTGRILVNHLRVDEMALASAFLAGIREFSKAGNTVASIAGAFVAKGERARLAKERKRI